jgi:Flp pilus assembly protein TadG
MLAKRVYPWGQETMFKAFRKLWNDKRGNALIIFGASLPLIMGAAGLASDTIQWALWKRELQRAADSAAIAGVYAKVQSGSYDAAVTTDLARNNDIADITVNKNVSSAPSAGAYMSDANAVRVTLSAKHQLSFSSMFMLATPTISATATATIVPAGDYCVVSLVNTGTTGISVGGTTDVDLGCGMITNSTSMDAAVAFGNSTVHASPIAAVGGIDAADNWDDDTVLLPFTMAQADPFKNVNPPTPSGCQKFSDLDVGNNNKPGGVVDLSSQTGIICIKENGGTPASLEIKGDVRLGKAIYVLDATSLKMTATAAKLSCNGCTIILTSSSTANPDSTIGGVDLSGGTANLVSPETGTYKGISIYQDRRAATGATNTISGNVGSSFEGAFYLPKQEVKFVGTSGVTFKCVQMVAWTVVFSGTSEVVNDCSGPGGGTTFAGQAVRLVE